MVGLLFNGRGILVTGIEERPNGARRVYLGARSKGLYILLETEAYAEVARAWNGHYGHLVLDRDDIEGEPIFCAKEDYGPGRSPKKDPRMTRGEYEAELSGGIPVDPAEAPDWNDSSDIPDEEFKDKPDERG